MDNWRSWRLQQWNEHLLAYFFGRRIEGDLPVVALVATPEELTRATGDQAADASEVRDAFVGMIRQTIHHSGSLFDDASNYQGWPSPPSSQRIPRFVAHLIFTCIAASESSEELASEGSYLQRLRDLAGGTLPDHSLKWLPKLWENLAEWLLANNRDYRPLKLPNPGSHTRIGYSVKLTFPDRRDQRALSELLGRAGLLGHDPPAGKVIALVASARGQFRAPFTEAFDDFRGLFARGSAHTRDILEHRFWSAVREASLRGRGAVEDIGTDPSAQFQILCEEQDDRLHPFLVTDVALAGGGLVAREMPIGFNIWRYAVVRDPPGHADPEAAYATARAVLQGSLSIPRLSSLVAQGLVPLTEGAHGHLEIAASEQLEDSRTALVRQELVQALIETFGNERARSRPSIVDGWEEVRGLRLRRLPSESLERSALDRCWQLHESVSRNGVRLKGGVKADDGWLGYREVLPRIVVPGARDVRIRCSNGKSVALRWDRETEWLLPHVDHEGEFEIEASMEDGSVERATARFNLIVGTQSIRMPDDLDAWIVEGVGGTATLSMLAPSTSSAGDVIAPVADRTVFLGPVVGQFVERPDEAAWRITTFAGRSRGARCRHDLADVTGTLRIAEKSSRLKWRRLLFDARADPSDDGFDAARGRIRQKALSGQQPIVDAPSSSVAADKPINRRVATEVERLLSIAAARAGSRTGIPYREWSRFVEQMMGMSRTQARVITRSWAEAGILDIGSYARWSHSRVFARAPKMLVFRTETGFGATMMGVLLPTTRLSLLAAARQASVDIEERCGSSTSTPALVTMRCSRLEQLDNLSRAAGIPWSWLDLNIEQYTEQCRQIGRSPPPQNYDDRVLWTRWSLEPIKDIKGLAFEHCSRPGRPDYWQVSLQNRSVWSYDLNTARQWAIAMLGEKPFADLGDAGIAAVHAFLPLPLARFASVVEGAPPGTNPSGRYQYCVGTRLLRDRLKNAVETIFDVRQLPEQAQAMMG